MSNEDSTVMRTVLIIFAALVVFLLISVTVANVLSHSKKSVDPEQDPRVQATLEANIKPIGQVNVGGVAPVVVAPVASADPIATFNSVCIACHGTGAMGAPKLGDKAAWKKRVAEGKSTLDQHAIHGFNNMPAKGGRSDLSDATIHAVVDYMVSTAK